MSHLSIIKKILGSRQTCRDMDLFQNFLHYICLRGTPVAYIENLYKKQPYKCISVPIFMDIAYQIDKRFFSQSTFVLI